MLGPVDLILAPHFTVRSGMCVTNEFWTNKHAWSEYLLAVRVLLVDIFIIITHFVTEGGVRLHN